MVVWSTIDATCPVCGNRLRLREVGSGFSTGQDSDLFVRMRGKHIIQAEIHTCHHCRFSGYTSDFFAEVSEPVRDRFLTEVAPLLVDENESGGARSRKSRGNSRGSERGASRRSNETPGDASADGDTADGDTADGGADSEGSSSAEGSESETSGSQQRRAQQKSTQRKSSKKRSRLKRCKTTPLPHVQYLWSAKTAEAIGLSSLEQAKRLLRGYWCLRIAPSANLDDKVLKKLRKTLLTATIRKFRQGLRFQKDPSIVFLVAELCRRNGNFSLSTRYFRRFLEREKNGIEYLRQAADKLLLAAEEKIEIELSMEEVLYNPAPDEEQ